MTASVVFDWMVEEGDKLATCKHDDPFAVLGPQKYKDKFIVRLWLPEAEKVKLLLEDSEINTEPINHHWIFEAVLTKKTGSKYQVKINRGGIEQIQNDNNDVDPFKRANLREVEVAKRNFVQEFHQRTDNWESWVPENNIEKAIFNAIETMTSRF